MLTPEQLKNLPEDTRKEYLQKLLLQRMDLHQKLLKIFQKNII